jgi:hypothetical protein
LAEDRGAILVGMVAEDDAERRPPISLAKLTVEERQLPEVQVTDAA